MTRSQCSCHASNMGLPIEMISRIPGAVSTSTCIALCDLYKYGNDIQLLPGDRVAVGTSAQAQFTDTIGPTLQIIGAATSALSLAVSAQALAK